MERLFLILLKEFLQVFRQNFVEDLFQFHGRYYLCFGGTTTYIRKNLKQSFRRSCTILRQHVKNIYQLFVNKLLCVLFSSTSRRSRQVLPPSDRKTISLFDVGTSLRGRLSADEERAHKGMFTNMFENIVLSKRSLF